MYRLTLSSKRLGILLLALCIGSLFLTTPGQAADQNHPTAPTETIIDSDITQDTTWTLANSPYRVILDIYVEPGITLTVEPGVTVYFGKNCRIHVGRDGTGGASIIAKGTPDQHITFTRYEDSYRWKNIRHYEGSSSYYRYVDFYWGGETEAILYYNGTGTHVLNHCEVQYSNRQGIVAIGSGLDLRIAGTLIRKNKRWGILTDSGANIHITGSEFYTDDDIAIYHRDEGVPSTITVNNSNFLTHPSYYAVWNEMSGSVINAQSNWWDAADGPNDGSDTSGSGCKVTSGVDYSNWLSAEVDPLVGITTPPTATFTVSPDPTVPQSPATVYTFDASGSTDAEDYTSSLEVCWDWSNSGTCDTWSTTRTTTHSFSGGGVQTVRLVVRDTDGDTDEATQDVHTGNLPVPAFTFTPTIWSQVVFDASASSDVETDVLQLQAGWDWEGNGIWDVTGVGVTEIQTHTYSHLGRYWPTLYVKDTDNLTDTLRKSVDIIPPATTVTITGSGGTLDSVDQTVQVAVYTDTVGGDVISNGLAITHNPWLTLPHSSLADPFLYQGFSLSAWSVGDDQPINEISGTYTITISYDCDYFADVLRLPPFEHQLRLYRWDSGTPDFWTLVDSALYATTDQLVATTGFFGDFALAMDVRRVYLPLVARAN